MSFGLPGWPGGDPGALDHAAQAWDALGDAVQEAVTTADTAIGAELSILNGATRDAFLEVWNTYANNQHQVANAAHTIATRLRTIGETIDEGHTKYVHVMEGLAAAAVVGVVLGAFTFGIGDAVVDSAAVATAASAIAGLLEWLGFAISEQVLAEIIGAALVQAVVGVEFEAVMQQGARLGEGEGLGVDWEGLAGAAASGAAFGGALRAAKHAGMALRVGLGGATAAGGTVFTSELTGEGMPTSTNVIVSVILGGLAGKVEGAFQDMEKAAAAGKAGATEAQTAVGLAALFKKDPEALLAIKNDPSFSDDVRYLALQYYQLFSKYPTLLHDVPSLATLLDDQPAQVGAVLRINTELDAVARSQHLPPAVVSRIWVDLAPHLNGVKAGAEGVSDFVKEWIATHKEIVEELERGLAVPAG